MFNAIKGYFGQFKAERERKALEEARSSRLTKIRSFQARYAKGSSELHSEFAYTVLSDVELEGKSLDDLDTLVAQVEKGLGYMKSVDGELEHKGKADQRGFVFTLNIPAPRQSCWLAYARRASDMSEPERHCVAFLGVLWYYRYISESEWQESSAALLGRPDRKFADPNRATRLYQTATEILDEPFLDIFVMDKRPPDYAFTCARAYMDRAMKKNPGSGRLARLLKEFKAKGVFPA